MNLKEIEENKRRQILGSREEWIRIQQAIDSAEKYIRPEHRKPQIQMAIKADSPLAKTYLKIP